MSDLHKQIAAARVRVKKLKKVMPEIFPQWQRLQQAERALERATVELKEARKAWKAL